MPTSPAPRQETLGFWMCLALVMGNMIGSGIFLLPASLAPYGGMSIVGWLISSGGALLIALVFRSLSRREPLAGGPYAYTRASFGDLAGFLMAWGYWISILATNAAVAVAFVSYLTVFAPALSSHPAVSAAAALATIWLLTFVNAMGVRSGGRMQVVTTALKILPLVAIPLLAAPLFDLGNFEPFNPSGKGPFSAATATVSLALWAFLGLESATVPAASVRDPERTIPRATILGTILTAALYITSTVAVMGILPREALAVSNAPFADAARALVGEWGAYAVGFGAAISCFGTLNGWILLQGQIPLAASSDRLFPEIFGRVSKNGTPVVGLVISSVLVTALVSMNYTRTLVEMFTFAILLATLTSVVPYLFSMLAEWTALLKERDRAAGAPFRPSGSRVIALAAFVYAFWAIAGSGQETVYWGFLLLLSGVPVFVWVRRRRGAAVEAP